MKTHICWICHKQGATLRLDNSEHLHGLKDWLWAHPQCDEQWRKERTEDGNAKRREEKLIDAIFGEAIVRQCAECGGPVRVAEGVCNLCGARLAA